MRPPGDGVDPSREGDRWRQIRFFEGGGIERIMARKLICKPALCVNCRTCEMSCSLEKSGMFNPVKARIWIQKSKKGFYTPMICRHCLEPPCEKACPVEEGKPIWRDKKTGIVHVFTRNCIGCYECVAACPFGAMRIDPHTGGVFKCDLCQGDPVCAKWCPTGAIQYVDTKALGTLASIDKI
jgi:carbon-monoxide dehydrogenase iron sulfur subunit